MSMRLMGKWSLPIVSCISHVKCVNRYKLLSLFAFCGCVAVFLNDYFLHALFTEAIYEIVCQSVADCGLWFKNSPG